MINRKTIKMLNEWVPFKRYGKQLSQELNVSDTDAKEMLTIQLVEHRFKDISDIGIQQMITANSVQLMTKVKYAKKDLARSYWHQKDIEHDKVLRLSSQISINEEIQPNLIRRNRDLERAVALIPNIFPNKSTQAWVQSVFACGSEETKICFNQSNRAFNSKLRKLIDYCQHHQSKMKCIANRQGQKTVEELNLLREYIILVDDAASDKRLGQWIYEHKGSSSLNQIVDSPLIKFQGKVLKDFVNSGVDRYTFNELIHARYIRLEQELKEKSNELSYSNREYCNKC
ncbi:hypothetical protein DMC16_15520 [Lacticaseibacillus paracasei]|uniref:hypothetical protein n=1 Tax=Lacticaseibacillus paracasei TaxID=1597 RepID=UPI000D75FD13|nr:hypothetical protein [Lacticaseibacillus paracasei]AWR92424.1 hypothetical protein DMC16_15520 [Lacticaseibacillus paracasei]